METFDFEKPINAEVALEDSDDERIPCYQNSNNISENGTEKEHCAVYNMPNIDEVLNQKETASPDTTLTSNNKSSNDSEKNINIVQKTPKKRKLHYEHSKERKICKKQNECIRKEITSEKLLDPKNLPLVNNNNGDESATRLRTETEMQTCLKIYTDLISSVCTNLITFTKMIQCYQKIYQDPNKLHEAINKNKSYYFSLTYTTVEIIFIPRKDNVEFRNHVINLTLAIAKEENIQCGFRDVEQLFCEMISWSQWKKTQIQMLRDTLNNRLQLNSCPDISPNIPTSKKPEYNDKFNYANSNLGTVGTNCNVNCTTSLHTPNFSQHNSNTTIQVQSNSIHQMGDIYLVNQISTPSLSNNSVQQNTTQALSNVQTGTNNYLQTGTVHWSPNSNKNNGHTTTKGYISQQTTKILPPPYQTPYGYNNYSTEFLNNSLQKASYLSSKQGYMTQSSRLFYPSNNHSSPEQLPSCSNNQLRSVNYLGNQTLNMHSPNVAQPTSTTMITENQLASNNQPKANNLPYFKIYNQSQNNFYNKNGPNAQSVKEQETCQQQEEYPDLARLLNSFDVSTQPGQNNSYLQQETSIDKSQDSRNSLSRDSGFMSPEYFNIGDEVVCMCISINFILPPIVPLS